MDETIPIIIWGCNDFAAQLVKYLTPSKVQVIAFADENPPQRFCDKPAYSPEILKTDADLQSIPIVVANFQLNFLKLPKVDFESVYQFKLKIQAIKQYNIQQQLLHPAALVDFLLLNFANKVITFGPPGSGITLLTHVCDKIMAGRKLHFYTKNLRHLFWQKMVFQYNQCILQTLPDVMQIHGGTNFHMSSWKLGMSYAISYFQDIRTEIYSFNTRNHICNNVYTYHYLPDAAALAQLKAQKFKMFFNMRDPLDMILSCMNKAGGVDNNSVSVDRKTLWFYAKMMIDQLNSLYPIPSEMIFFNYEKLISQPIETIRSLARELGVWISKRRANKIWNQLSFKSLPQAPSRHFWHGGCGKWEKYFSSDDLAILKSLGIEEVLEKYNYHKTLATFKNLCQKNIDEIEITADEKVNDKFYYERHEVKEDVTAAINYLAISCSDISIRERLINTFKSSYLNQLIMAGAHSNYRST